MFENQFLIVNKVFPTLLIREITEIKNFWDPQKNFVFLGSTKIH